MSSPSLVFHVFADASQTRYLGILYFTLSLGNIKVIYAAIGMEYGITMLIYYYPTSFIESITSHNWVLQLWQSVLKTFMLKRLFIILLSQISQRKCQWSAMMAIIYDRYFFEHFNLIPHKSLLNLRNQHNVLFGNIMTIYAPHSFCSRIT